MVVTNTTCTNDATEYSVALPNYCEYFLIKCRQEGSELWWTTVSGQSGTKYMTIPAGSFYWQYAKLTGKTLYFQSPAAGTVVEVIAASS